MVEFFVKRVVQEPVTKRFSVVLQCSQSLVVIRIAVSEASAKQIFKLLNSENQITPDVFNITASLMMLNDTSNPERVVLEDYSNGVFKARFYIIINGEEHAMDCRPSDAFALALATKTPIYIEKKILEMDDVKKLYFNTNDLKD